jgi:hypothetical protein
MGLLLLIAALVLLFVPGLFAAQATVGWIILAVLAIVTVLQLVVFATAKRSVERIGRSFDRW